MDLTAFPGGDLVQEGLADLARGVESIPSLLVSIGAPRLRRIGLAVPETVHASPEHRLYETLAESDSDSAHSRYNALVRRLVSFENAAECAGLGAPEPAITDFNSLEETAYLLRNPKNAERLLEAIADLERGCVADQELAHD
jgi:hypothetical protein